MDLSRNHFQRNSSWNAPYTFSGKEKDAETGNGYVKKLRFFSSLAFGNEKQVFHYAHCLRRFGARYYDSGLSVWLSVDPLSDKYPTLSPYTYCANNPIMLVDPDGRWILGINNKPIDYTRNSDGSITWTKNTTDDVKLLGNIMLQTNIGTFWFDAMKNAQYNITIEIDNTEQIDKRILGGTQYSYGENETGPEGLINPERVKGAKIIIYQNSIQNNIDSPNGIKKGLPLSVAMASTLVHEAVHATDFGNIRDCLLYKIVEAGDMFGCFYNAKEHKPTEQAKLFLDQYKDLNK